MSQPRLAPREPLAPLVVPRHDPELRHRASLREVVLITGLCAAVIGLLVWILAQYPPVVAP